MASKRMIKRALERAKAEEKHHIPEFKEIIQEQEELKKDAMNLNSMTESIIAAVSKDRKKGDLRNRAKPARKKSGKS